MIEYNCYNEAFHYLKDKYGYVRADPVGKLKKLLEHRSKKDQKRIIEDSTDDDYYLLLNPIIDERDKKVELLMNQYVYGLSVRKELYYLLEEIKNEKKVSKDNKG